MTTFRKVKLVDAEPSANGQNVTLRFESENGPFEMETATNALDRIANFLQAIAADISARFGERVIFHLPIVGFHAEDLLNEPGRIGMKFVGPGGLSYRLSAHPKLVEQIEIELREARARNDKRPPPARN